MMQIDRWVSSPGLSPREAAFVTGLSEKTINQAIDRLEVQPLPARRTEDRERTLPFAQLLYLRLRVHLGRLLSAEGKRKLRQQLERAAGDREHPAVVDVGGLRVNVASEVESLRQRLA